MSTKFPLIPDPITGIPRPIASPETIDSSVLPTSSAGSSVPTYISTGVSYTVSGQVYAPLDITSDGEIVCDGELVFA